MSVILKALKNSAAEGKGPDSAEQLPAEKTSAEKKQPPVFEEGEGFFSAKPSYVQKSELPELIKKAPAIRRPVLILSGLLVAAITFSVVLHFLKGRQMPASQQTPDSALTAAANVPPVVVDVTAMAAEAKNLFDNGDLDGAQTLYKKAIASDAENALLHNGLGLVYLKKDLYANAQTEFESALAIDDKCAECLNSLGMVKSLTDNATEAKTYLEKAVRLASDYPDPYFNLAVLNEKMGDFGNAVKNYRQFMLLYPNETDGVKAKVRGRIALLTGETE